MLEPFQFDRDAYPGTQLKNRINYYISSAQEGLSIAKKDKHAAMSILKELRDNLDVEYSYYSTSRFEKIISSLGDRDLDRYIEKVKHARAKIIRTNQFAYLTSNLFDISSYIGEIDGLDDDKLYGHVQCKMAREKFDNTKNEDPEYQFLSKLLQFYSGPTVQKLEALEKVKGNFDIKQMEQCINFELLKRVNKKR
ncbi:hypothetical protein BI362_00840 [Streptococcus parauberis]|nr:hypothetical protein BI362_00840 [Streptococcus parauberis]QBX27675.1 hypothetical protein Javan406_0025 [Streptococcus phage Javan406]